MFLQQTWRLIIMANENFGAIREQVSNLVDLLYTSANKLTTISNVQYKENWSDSSADDFSAGCEETKMLLKLVPRIEKTLSKNGYDILYQPKPYELKGKNFMQQRRIDTSALKAQNEADGLAKTKILNFKTKLEDIVALVEDGIEEENTYASILNIMYNMLDTMYSITIKPGNTVYHFSKRDFYFEVPVRAIFDYLENKLLPTLKDKVDSGIQQLKQIYDELNSRLNELQDLKKKFRRLNSYKGLISAESAAKVYAFEAGMNRQLQQEEILLRPRE